MSPCCCEQGSSWPQMALGTQAWKLSSQHARKRTSFGEEEATQLRGFASLYLEGPSALPECSAQSHSRDPALSLAHLAKTCLASSVTSQEGAGSGSVGNVTGAFLAPAPLLPFLLTRPQAYLWRG